MKRQRPCKGCGQKCQAALGVCDMCRDKRSKLRNRQALVMRECGIKAVEIAKHFGVSRGRANFMIRAGKRQFMKQRAEWEFASGRFRWGMGKEARQ